MVRIGLVLGAGGVAGHAFHAGVLSALAESLAWDARSADVIVGTSAGSHVGALLRAGLHPHDIAARYTGRPLSEEGRRLVGRTGPPEPIPRPMPRAVGPAAPRMLLRAASHPFSARLGALASGLMPTGVVPLDHFAARIRWLFGSDWPSEPLWLPAVRLTDGRRVAFGRDGAPATDVGTAVAASCAVPGWFRPVVVDGVRYVDGGAHSPTNADLLVAQDLDLVVVSSPMSLAAGVRRASVDLPARVGFRLRLLEEAGQLRRRGVPVVAFQPGLEDLAAMGVNAMSDRRRVAVVDAARESTLRRLERPRTRARLEALAA